MSIFLAVLVSFLITALALVLVAMSQDTQSYWGVGILLGCIFLMVFSYMALPIQRMPQYKAGQIDALNGEVHYELVTKSDSTRTWKYIAEED